MKKLSLFLSLLLFLSITIAAKGAPISAKDLEADIRYFSDATCTQLTSGFQEKQLEEIKTPQLKALAQALLAKKYDAQYRVTDYAALLSDQKLSEQLKLGRGFSQYENITGMYLEEGQAIIMVGPTQGKKITLLLPYWMRKPAEGIQPTKDPNGWGLHAQRVTLTEGINIVNVERSTNAYIGYFDDSPKTAPKIKIHFITGKVNRYFDGNTQTNEDWNKLLDNAVSPIMDAVGKNIQVAYPVEWFKKYTYGKGIELLNNYDKMLFYEYEMMGFHKYNKVPERRILARVNFNYYMFRDGDGVAYLGDAGTMKRVADPDQVLNNAWGFCHEVGHVLQMRTWGGMGEVSNNILTMYATTKVGNPSRLKAGQYYAKARKAIIEAEPRISYLQNGDVFNSLVPFWQLHLYFTKNGHPDFYPDLMEGWRKHPVSDGSSKNMLDFIKLVCDVGKTDLTDFFDKWGFFYVGTMPINDYGKYEYKVTQEMVDEVKAYIAKKNYPKPTMDVTTIEDDEAAAQEVW
ncbi:MAG: M60 family metallopeptidase [Puniceicoccales bacterium]|jgi:hypothetical protein|nr:M60 family metallopeptidase [Puniceicoccales bacterium]